MADDVLANLTPADVASFYSRLADGVDARRGKLDVSLAALLMRLWLSNRAAGAQLTIDAPTHLRNHPQTTASLLYHRQVFLTEKKARLGKTEIWAGSCQGCKAGRPIPDGISSERSPWSTKA